MVQPHLNIFWVVCWHCDMVFLRWHSIIDYSLLRPQCTCLRCSSTAVDDEAHWLLLSEHPTLVEARYLFLSAVVPPVTARSSLRYADFWALSSTGSVPLSALVKFVAVCVRVCRYCHQWRFWVILTKLLDLMSRHMLSYMPKFTRILFHLAVLCGSLRCGAYGTYFYGIS